MKDGIMTPHISNVVEESYSPRGPRFSMGSSSSHTSSSMGSTSSQTSSYRSSPPSSNDSLGRISNNNDTNCPFYPKPPVSIRVIFYYTHRHFSKMTKLIYFYLDVTFTVSLTKS
jgi:hypothetical protein